MSETVLHNNQITLESVFVTADCEQIELQRRMQKMIVPLFINNIPLNLRLIQVLHAQWLEF